MRKINGRYEIREQLGQGGMGVVYRAYNPPPLSREVAVKMLPELADELALELFYKECNLVKSLSHPNIVEIYDIGEFREEGKKKPFFVMPILRGQTLDRLIKETSHRLTVERVVEIISQTCRGLQAAHEHGLVHRDLKPSNIFVMPDDSVKIIDFGLARALDSGSRSAGFQKGTLLYMAPEQLENKPITTQTDIFSLGVVCYEALTKGHPFRGSSEEEVVAAILTRIPPPVSSINPGVSQSVSQAVHKAMAKQPQPWARYESAKEFGEILQKALRNQPIEIFDPVRIQPRLDRAAKAIAAGNDQLASEIVRDLELAGHVDPQIAELRAEIDRVSRHKTIAQLLESARARYEEDEDPLALQKLQEVLQLDPTNVQALGLKSTIEDRRSERQIEKWIRLAEEHIVHHAYDHARQALENVLAMRPREPKAIRLQKELESAEREYVRLRQEKAELYQLARNAWTNGDVSEALSQMRRVLELDHRAPDVSSADTASTYQNFYDTVRSDHDAINSRYAEARRCLAEEDFTKALAICQEVLAKYPSQMLFQALKVDIEEQQRQQVSAYIVDVTRRLDAEFDLNAKVNLLREAVARHPAEPHFERSLKLMEGRRDLVNSIVSRAKLHEERGQFGEAISDLETLQTIYSPYPGLAFEIDRLRKRRAQQSRDAVKSDRLRDVDHHIEAANYMAALEILEKTRADFPDDPEFHELENRTRQLLEGAREAEQLLAEGQRLHAAFKFDESLQTLRRAHQLDDHNPRVRHAFRDALIERARVTLETDWRAAESLVESALEFDPQHAVAKSLRAQISDRKREEAVAQCAALVRRLQADGELEKAASELKRVLAIYPRDQRLTTVLETVQRDLTQSTQKRERLSDLEQLRHLQKQAETVVDGKALESIFEQTRTVVGRHRPGSEESDISSVAREIERIVRARGGPTDETDVKPATPPGTPETQNQPDVPEPPRPETPKPELPKPEPPKPELPKPELPKPEPPKKEDTSVRRPKPVGGRRTVRVPLFGPVPIGWAVLSAVAVLVVLVGGAMVGRRLWTGRTSQQGATQAASVRFHVRTVPSGATIRVGNETRGVSDLQLGLAPGDYEVTASLPGYEPATKKVSVAPGSSPDIALTLQPLAQTLRIVAPDIDSGGVRLDENSVGNLQGGEFTVTVPAGGSHQLRISTPKLSKQDATITFEAAPGALPTVTLLESQDRQLVAVTSFAGTAHITSTLGTLAVAIDGKPQGSLAPEGLTVQNLGEGTHALALGAGNDLRTMSFSVGPAPALDAILYSGRDVGSIRVMTGEDGVDVFVDGKRYSRKTKSGQLALTNLSTTQHSIRVSKEGFIQPDTQDVTVVKNQEQLVTFTLAATPTQATLMIQGGTPRAQVFLDDVFLGPVNEDGRLSRSDIKPGSHTIRVELEGHQSKRHTREFKAGETVSLSGAEVGLQPVPKPDNPPAGRVALPPPPAVEGMAEFENADKWVKTDDWYKRRGGEFALYNRADPRGQFVFTVQLPSRGFIAFNRPHIRWVVGFVDAKNYILFDMDSKELSRVEMIDGQPTNRQTKPHNVPWEDQVIHISIEVAPTHLVHRFKRERPREEWRTLDDWDRSSSPSAARVRDFSVGKFGFYLPGKNDEIQISNFSFIPPGR